MLFSVFLIYHFLIRSSAELISSITSLDHTWNHQWWALWLTDVCTQLAIRPDTVVACLLDAVLVRHLIGIPRAPIRPEYSVDWQVVEPDADVNDSKDLV